MLAGLGGNGLRSELELGGALDAGLRPVRIPSVSAPFGVARGGARVVTIASAVPLPAAPGKSSWKSGAPDHERRSRGADVQRRTRSADTCASIESSRSSCSARRRVGHARRSSASSWRSARPPSGSSVRCTSDQRRAARSPPRRFRRRRLGDVIADNPGLQQLALDLARPAAQCKSSRRSTRRRRSRRSRSRPRGAGWSQGRQSWWLRSPARPRVLSPSATRCPTVRGRQPSSTGTGGRRMNYRLRRAGPHAEEVAEALNKGVWATPSARWKRRATATRRLLPLPALVKGRAAAWPPG